MRYGGDVTEVKRTCSYDAVFWSFHSLSYACIDFLLFHLSYQLIDGILAILLLLFGTCSFLRVRSITAHTSVFVSFQIELLRRGKEKECYQDDCILIRRVLMKRPQHAAPVFFFFNFFKRVLVIRNPFNL